MTVSHSESQQGIKPAGMPTSAAISALTGAEIDRPPEIGSEEEITVLIETAADIVIARQNGREMALNTGFSPTDATLIATIISELARNILLYAKTGEMELANASNGNQSGIIITGRDNGPGIADIQRAILGGYSTSGGLGLGLCGVRRMADEFHIDSASDRGTIVTAKKWLRQPRR